MRFAASRSHGQNSLERGAISGMSAMAGVTIGAGSFRRVNQYVGLDCGALTDNMFHVPGLSGKAPVACCRLLYVRFSLMPRYAGRTRLHGRVRFHGRACGCVCHI